MTPNIESIIRQFTTTNRLTHVNGDLARAYLRLCLGEIDDLRKMIGGLAERVAKQSELLERKAEARPEASLISLQEPGVGYTAQLPIGFDYPSWHTNFHPILKSYAKEGEPLDAQPEAPEAPEAQGPMQKPIQQQFNINDLITKMIESKFTAEYADLKSQSKIYLDAGFSIDLLEIMQINYDAEEGGPRRFIAVKRSQDQPSLGMDARDTYYLDLEFHPMNPQQILDEKERIANRGSTNHA